MPLGLGPLKRPSEGPSEGHFAVAALFEIGNRQDLRGAAATRAGFDRALTDQSYLHFSCHGYYNWDDVMKSGLVLAKGDRLTPADILSRVNLSATRLVTLSACETGITDFRTAPDEFVGLPAGLLQAGAPGVIATLWAVNDLSNMLLVERFYQHHLRDKLSPADALRKAQLWLRDATAKELSERFDREMALAPDRPRQPRMAFAAAEKHFTDYALQEGDKRPFADPYYWAGFAAYGV